VTLEQRQGFEEMLSDSINAWTDYLVGYENWPYDHIDVKIVGWAVLDENCIVDPQPDEIIYTTTKYYDSQYDTSNGVEEIPNLEPYAPDELSRMYHFENRLDPDFDAYNYPGGLDKRFDMYMWATQGFPSIGGCGGDWGQRLSDTAYLNMLDGAFPHVQVHEVGHAFGITDFYGGEGESDGFPPGGFPGNGTSIMMAGSSMEITDFDGWLLRYMWTQIKDEDGRFDMENALPEYTETTTTTTTTTTATTISSGSETTTTTTTTTEPQPETKYLDFPDGTLLAFQNANSSLYLGVENGDAFNMANICQYGTGSMKQNIWTVKSAGDGSYYLYSKLEDGETYLLDVYYANTADGTNIGIYENTGSPAQCFRFVDNGDGTCSIVTQCTGGQSCIQVAGSASESGANIEQSAFQGDTHQKWIVKTPRLMGYRGDLNGDDQISVMDCVKMNKYLIGMDSLSSNPMEFKDVNNDNKLNIFDAVILKNMCRNRDAWVELYDCEE
ncbi:MAG: RICIN domain-containing protein, partial [Ruminococcus sp.]